MNLHCALTWILWILDAHFLSPPNATVLKYCCTLRKQCHKSQQQSWLLLTSSQQWCSAGTLCFWGSDSMRHGKTLAQWSSGAELFREGRVSFGADQSRQAGRHQAANNPFFSHAPLWLWITLTSCITPGIRAQCISCSAQAGSLPPWLGLMEYFSMHARVNLS